MNKKSYQFLTKNVLTKKYKELRENDVPKIIKKLNLDSNTSMFKSKERFILHMCTQKEDVEYFDVKGKTMPRLVSIIDISDKLTRVKSSAYIMSILDQMEIKPSAAFVVDEYATLDFYPMKDFHFNHWSDYLKLVIDFITYLEELRKIGINLTYIDPYEYGLAKEIDENAQVLSDITFSEELFNSDKIEFYGEITGELDIKNIQTYSLDSIW